ncbi:squalene synthase HpnC [Aquabacterium sp. OR-4]|uniref:squalene synthase HpnC n=1 Tax=Aquabacterium sp. OR-4 TaxID=2978127 RepID=UPI0021B20B50|nr:squalene synthase HpnC [Aquabacterium sp. OR-4]MDT7835243.1 squalene synthase HpnC [Aquabacterium sp. OR-4]
MSVNHYENFPVASWLCPPAMRGAVVAIYHFARSADDMADEGDAPAAQRRSELARYRAALHRAALGTTQAADWPAVFNPLAEAMARHRLPLAPLNDLLSAFERDTHNPRYPDRTALLDYCRHSANPVGRLMLHLAGVHDARSLAQSDAICTALQLINFWQDPSRDLPRGRHYVPEADAQRHGLRLDDLAQLAAAGRHTPQSQALWRELCTWAGTLMHQGAPLALRVPGRLGWELRLVVQGGLRILEKIEAMQFRCLNQRPVLGPLDGPLLLWRAWRMQATPPAAGVTAR